ncbi:hypothetical protein A176_006216 [Myxococcus hansupus]|uniref:Uncharacterized protein n=1 Tax=Pseudomyxococcus hansupus TaxID=1297742 RepID=A0A0H4X2C3_9BACT|nr:TIGR02996 domain-containing protein [Myxococcus hansupus]AKQ69304.1 hypothetical protein A176_006216 [Myxococcus hansupus]
MSNHPEFPQKPLPEAAADGQWPMVLLGLLEAWRAAPHRELADRIARVGAKVAQEQPLSGDWETLANTRDATRLSLLLGALLDKGSVKARSRLESLGDWPTDPRIDRWVAAQYADPPFTSTGARPFWTRLAPLARRIRDAQARETLAKARAGYDSSVSWQEFLAGHLDRLQPELDAVRDVDLAPDLRKALDAIDQALNEATHATKPARSGDAAALLANVLTNPEDDDARAVLADVLLETGHPRGELIALQLEATRRALKSAEARRERELIKTARAELLGPLDAVLKPGCTFTRGFLSHAALKQGNARALASAIEKTVGHPLWSTVEHLEGFGDRDITPHEVMRSLRSIAQTDVGIDVLARLPKLESLATNRRHEAWPELASNPSAFPRLRALDAAFHPRQIPLFLTSPLATRLERLQLRLHASAGLHLDVDFLQTHVFERVASLKATDLTLRLVHNDARDWSSGCRFVHDATGALTATVFTTPMNEPFEAIVQADVLSLLEQAARLRPVKLVMAHQFRTAHRDALDARARELGA